MIDRDALISPLSTAGSADLVVRGGKVVNVITGEVDDGGVAIKGERILFAGDVERFIGERTQVIEAGGRYITPGLIETHLHSYHSLLNPTEHARVTLKTGTTALPESYYAPGIVAGFDAIEFFLDELRRTPINILFNVPVFAYAQNRDKGIEGTWDDAAGRRLWETLDWPECVAVEEPSYDALSGGSDLIMELISDAVTRGKVVMGDGTGLTGARLQTYAAMGVTMEHEVGSAEEAMERIRLGISVAMRRASLIDNQSEVQRAITEHGFSTQNFVFCSDLLDAATAMHVGHIDESIRIAVRGGIDPMNALQMATINAARAFRVDHECGSLAPGRRADVLVVGDLSEFDVQTVVAKGEVVVHDGIEVAPLQRPEYPDWVSRGVVPDRGLTGDDFRVEADGDSAVVRVMGGESLFTDERHIKLAVRDGSVDADESIDVLKIAMVPKDGSSLGIGFVQGWGLKNGAVASTYVPMTFEPLVLGTSDEAMGLAVNAISEVGGGVAVVRDGEVVARLALPLCGIMSATSAEETVQDFEAVIAAIQSLGCTRDAPVHFLAWLGLGGVVPELKITAQGLFRVSERRWVPTLVAPDEGPPPETVASRSKGQLTLNPED